MRGSLFESSSSADLLGLLEFCCSSSRRQPEEGHVFVTHGANLSAVGVFFLFSCVKSIFSHDHFPLPHDFLNLRFPHINPCNPVDISSWSIEIP